MADFFREEWPTSAERWQPGGTAPAAGALFCNPVLAETWKQVVREAEATSDHEAGIERARDAFYRGFIAEAIEGFFRQAEVIDASDARHRGVLSAADLAGFAAPVETPAHCAYPRGTNRDISRDVKR